MLEDGCWSLGGRRALRDLCPVILQEHKAIITERVAGKKIAAIFDGSRVTAPAETILFRFLENWEITQLCVTLQLLAKNPNGDEMVKFFLDVLDEYDVPRESVYAAQRDGASTNAKMMRSLRTTLGNSCDLSCLSHALNNTGNEFLVPTCRRYLHTFNAMVTRSPLARSTFKNLIKGKLQMPGIRWWREVMQSNQTGTSSSLAITRSVSRAISLERAPPRKSSCSRRTGAIWLWKWLLCAM